MTERVKEKWRRGWGTHWKTRVNNAKAAGTPRAGTREVEVVRIQEPEDGLQVEMLEPGF